MAARGANDIDARRHACVTPRFLRRSTPRVPMTRQGERRVSASSVASSPWILLGPGRLASLPFSFKQQQEQAASAS